MGLDRNTLSRIDRRLLAELDGDGGVQMVKVPVSDVVWSVWRRYCDAVGVTMGEGVAALIATELATVIVDGRDREVPVFADRTVQRVVDVTQRLKERERELTACKTRLVERDREVRDLRHRLRTAIRRPQPSRGARGATSDVHVDLASSTNIATASRGGGGLLPDNGLLVQTAGSARNGVRDIAPRGG